MKIYKNFIPCPNSFRRTYELVYKNGWYFYIVPSTEILYKGAKIDINKATDMSQFVGFYFYMGTPDVAYIYAYMHYFTHKNVSIIGFKPIRDLYLFDIFNVYNCNKLIKRLHTLHKLTGNKLFTTLIDYIGYTLGYTKGWDKTKKYYGIDAVYPVEYYKYNNIKFGDDSTEFSRTSFKYMDTFLCDSIRAICPCDGYLGIESPSIFHKVFHFEVCIFDRNNILSIHSDAPYSSKNIDYKKIFMVYSSIVAIFKELKKYKLGGNPTIVLQPENISCTDIENESTLHQINDHLLQYELSEEEKKLILSMIFVIPVSQHHMPE